MRSLKIIFGGPGAVSIDWNAEVSDLSAVAQRGGVSVMTRRGSDTFLPDRGTDVATALLSYGAFDILGVQHALNFGALKARGDMINYEDASRDNVDKVARVSMSLIDVKDNSAQVGVSVANQAGESTTEITEVS